MKRDGLLIVISAPSGTGKSTLLKILVKNNKNLRFSVSITTRMPRENEREGRNYFFTTPQEFKGMIDRGELIEWTEYCGNYYGTPKKFIQDCISDGLDVVLEVEVEGALNIRKKFLSSVLIFVLPPSSDELKRRIKGRGTESTETISKRLEKAAKEIEFVDRYDYIVINDKIENSVNDINSIITAEKLKYEKNKNILKDIGLNIK